MSDIEVMNRFRQVSREDFWQLIRSSEDFAYNYGTTVDEPCLCRFYNKSLGLIGAMWKGAGQSAAYYLP